MGYYKELDIEFQEQKAYVVHDLDLEEVVMICEDRADAEEMALAFAEEASYEAYVCSNYDELEEEPADPRDFALPWVGFYIKEVPYVRRGWHV